MPDEATMLPCPFCGRNKVEVWSFMKEGKATVAWTSVCVAEHDHGGGCVANGPAMPTEAEAIAAWNTRADPLQERIAELESALREMLGAPVRGLERLSAIDRARQAHRETQP